MKIICSRENLLLGVNTVQRAVATKNTMPILQGIKLKTENSSLWFEATDLEIGVRCKIPMEVKEEGEVVLPAKLFSEFVRKLPDSDIIMESIDNNVAIYYNNSNFVINGYNPEEYPEIAYINSAETIEIPAAVFKKMIRQTIFACAVEETRPVFTGILVEVENENMSLVSTDSHRLAYSKVILPNNEKNFKGIIPSKTMQELLRLLDDDEILTVQYNNSKIIFKFNSCQILTRLIDGQFPNYQQVIPQSCNTKLLVNCKNLLDTVERASLLSRDNYLKINNVRFNIEDSILNVNQYSEMGKISEKIEIEKEGENVAISFNAKYIIDVLRTIDTENIVLEASGSYSPCVFRPENEQNYLYLLLPLRN
ncbi:MAG: DNA polymerase III subunit beta [Peptococcaceae bacterium]|nr:DNA polymerase III subunit beta [Peptococcaceae bacterium]